MDSSDLRWAGASSRGGDDVAERAISQQVVLVPHGFETNYTVGLVRGLVANGIVPYVITSDPDHARIAALGVPCHNLRGDVSSTRPWHVKLGNLLFYYLRLTRLVVRLRPTVIHFTGLFRNELFWFEAPFFSMLFRLCAGRYVHTVHNILPHGRDDSIMFRFGYRAFVYSLPHALVAHTRDSMARLRDQFGVPARKLHLGTIGLNEEIPIRGVDRDEARRRLGLEARDRVVLFFGRIDRYKGLDLLLEAVDQMNVADLTLVVAGAFLRPELRSETEDRIQRLRPEMRVVLRAGNIPNEDVELYFRSCDVLAMPYRAVTQSGVLFLALAFGVPIVASDVGGLGDFVDAETGILVPPSDVPALAAGIERFFAHRDGFDRDRIARNARKLTWSNAAAPIAGIYRDALSSRAT